MLVVKLSGICPLVVFTRLFHPPNGEKNSRGEWVMGVGEPVLLLFGEFSYTDEINEVK